ncbi:phospholipase/Carboxylesterase [Colletotrichum limetticola]|uniref:Phospholipase/Carboxylesterase n=1 Tax=Colletotrichum limetticola TaxID=1209924 RepID=A0ABQ9PNT6_9PEZI|nr:phospholipase/Carboxylesterase [Colletotrichum limetticola]
MTFLTDVFHLEPAPGHEHTHTVILLHGRGSDGKEFADEFFECEVSEHLARILDDGPEQPNNPLDDTPAPPPHRTLQALYPTFKWVFPSAPSIPSKRYKTDMTQWFDMWSTENPNEQEELQEPSLSESIDFINRLIDRESHVVSPDKIFLGGISQGFATAVAAYLTRCKALGGLIGYASWAYPGLSPYQVPTGPVASDDGKWKIKCGDVNYQMARTPIFLSHARDDPTVPVKNGRALCKALHNIGLKEVQWHEYEYGGHWITEPDSIDQLVYFIHRNVGLLEDDSR